MSVWLGPIEPNDNMLSKMIDKNLAFVNESFKSKRGSNDKLLCFTPANSVGVTNAMVENYGGSESEINALSWGVQ